MTACSVCAQTKSLTLAPTGPCLLYIPLPMPSALDISALDSIKSVMNQIWTQVQEQVLQAASKPAQFVDRHLLKALGLQPSDEVWLATKNICLRQALHYTFFFIQTVG